MPTRINPIHEAARSARTTTYLLGRELRLARLMGGRTQAQVARAIGTSAAQVSRIEHGRVPSLTIRDAHRLAAAVGMRLHVRAYPNGRRVLDQPQLTLLERLRRRLHPRWAVDLELPIPRPGDLRAIDAVIRLDACRVAVEAITRLVDIQAQVRAAQLKRRDINADRLILLVAATTANRHALRSADLLLAAAFPLSTRRTLASLAAGEDPGADAIVLL